MDVTETDMKKAEAFYRGTKTLCHLADEKVIPVLKAVLQPSDFDQALIVTYYRIQLWLYALEMLDHPKHFQTVLNAARGVYELLLDLKLLKADPSYVPKFHAFPEVARFHAADLYTIELAKYPSCVPPVKSILRQTTANDPVKRQKHEQTIQTHWPNKNNKTPDHWSGLAMAGRATKLGPDEAIRYRYVYSTCSWFVHPGSAGVAEISPRGLLGGFGWGHEIIQEFFIEATELIADSQNIFEGMPSLRDDLKLASIETTRVYTELEKEGLP